MEPRKILIRGPNWVGDCVLSIPAMKAVRTGFPQAEITLLVRPWVAGLFRSVPFIDHLWTEPRPTSLSEWSRITTEIRRRHFDLALLLPNSFESALMVFLGRVPQRIGYTTDGRRLLLTNPVQPRLNGRHQVYYYLDLAATLSGVTFQPTIEIKATTEEKQGARQLLEAEGIDASRPFLLLNPGAAYGSAKRWDPQRFAQAADRLAGKFHFQVAIIGSESERAAGELVRTQMKTPASLLSGKTTLETLIGVLAQAALMITNDSGPMHIAAALGVPTVAIFGSTDEHVTGPVSMKARVVKHRVECSPCLLRECPIDHRCMTRVSVEDVVQAAMEIHRTPDSGLGV